MKPEELLTLSKEELIEKLQALNFKEEEVMANMVMIRQELLYRLESEKKDGELIGEYSITKAKRINFKTTLEQALELGAVCQAIDSKELRKLYNKGVKVPGVNETIYLSVRRLSQEEAEK